jgi:hypothetical protein
MNNTIPLFDNTHPEDNIYKTKTFINELQFVQEKYFTELANKLNLTKEGENWLFDYVYNCDDEVDDFSHFLSLYNKKYEDFVKENNLDTRDVLHPTNFEGFAPITHMSSYEPELELFPNIYDVGEHKDNIVTINTHQQTDDNI